MDHCGVFVYVNVWIMVTVQSPVNVMWLCRPLLRVTSLVEKVFIPYMECEYMFRMNEFLLNSFTLETTHVNSTPLSEIIESY